MTRYKIRVSVTKDGELVLPAGAQVIEVQRSAAYGDKPEWIVTWAEMVKD